MNKILATVATLLMVLSFSTIKAMDEPANKNLLNPEYFETRIEDNTVASTSAFNVEVGVTYTFSMPAQIGDVHVRIQSALKQDTYVDESPNPQSGVCEVDWFVRSCTFEAQDDTLIFEMFGGDIAQQVHFYGMDGFQLEKGSVATDYVKYEPLETVPPKFGGEGTLIIGYDTPTSTQTLVDNHITAVDEIDGDLTSSIQIISDAYKDNASTLGTYPVELYAEDSSGNAATFTLNVKVVDTVAPIIESPDKVTIDVDAPSTVGEIITSNVTFYDAYEGSLSQYTIITETYTGNETLLGESMIEFEIEDGHGNQTAHTLTINTVDTKAPTVNGASSQTIYQSDMKTVDELFALYSSSDNHSDDIAFEVKSHTLPQKGESGNYTMTLRAVDASGNETLRVITITIKDDISPTIRGFNYAKESYKDTFDLVDYIAKLDVDDNDFAVTTDDIIIIKNPYQSGVLGKYKVIFELVDDFDNSTRHQLIIDVVDDVAPTFEYSHSIQTTINTELNETHLIKLTSENDVLTDFEAVNYQVVNNTYSGNASKEGNYVYTVEYMNQKGDTVTSSIDIEVLSISDPTLESDGPIISWLLLPTGLLMVGGYILIKKRK